jgi:2-oxoglutarate ferredoxin oxidoreductase subunit gamma
MYEEIVISGFGGQGVLFTGQMLAYAGNEEGRYVTWIPSYGPEMRGGTAHCTVIISDEEIGSPVTGPPTAALVLNEPSMELYAPLVKPGGVLICDSAMIARRSSRPDIREIDLPAKAIASELGFPQVANMAMVGALAAATEVVQLKTLEKVLEEHLGSRHREALEANKEALASGVRLANETAAV